MNTEPFKGWTKWEPLYGVYFDPYDTDLIARAKSILYVLVGHVELTAEQARDVIGWAE